MKQNVDDPGMEWIIIVLRFQQVDASANRLLVLAGAGVHFHDDGVLLAVLDVTVDDLDRRVLLGLFNNGDRLTSLDWR